MSHRIPLLFALMTACSADSGGDGTGGTTAGTTTDGTDTSGSSTGAAGCQTAVVTDIDETLTLTDAEYLMQLQDGTYDPLGREGGPELVNGYADLGYHVVYLTARNEDAMLLVTDEPSRDATERWLLEHGYPFDDNARLIMAPNFVFGEQARQYKAGALGDLQDMGFELSYAYGNATSDIDAYADVMIPKDSTFIIGDNAGQDGTVAITGDAWTDHAAAHLPTVMAVCDAAP